MQFASEPPAKSFKERRRTKSQQYKKVYKNSRRVFRTVAFGAWALAAVYGVVNQSQQAFQPASDSLSSLHRSRRSADEVEPQPESEPEKNVCEVELEASDNPVKQNNDEYFKCMVDRVWFPKCYKPDTALGDTSMDKMIANFSSDYGNKHLKQGQWLSHFEKSDKELIALCCIGSERKHEIHNGPIDEFPKLEVFDHAQIRSGFWVVHLLVSLYMFGALAIVCDDYFVPALERLSEALELSEDVAGATFMAAGSSAPELFTSVIGVFVAKSDIGIGTIVGSAVFNILVIIGCCGLFVKGDIELSWWPLFRDSMFYLFTIITLLIVIYPAFDDFKCETWVPMEGVAAEVCTANPFNDLIKNADEFKTQCSCQDFEGLSTTALLYGEAQKFGKSEVTLIEAIAMLIMYSLYIVIMKYNQDLEKVFAKLFGYDTREESDDAQQEQGGAAMELQVTTLKDEQERQTTPLMSRKQQPSEQTAQTPKVDAADVQNAISKQGNTSVEFDNAGLRVMMTSGFAPRTRLRMAAKLVAKNQDNFVVAKQTDAAGNTSTVLLQKKAGGDEIAAEQSANTNNNNNCDIEMARNSRANTKLSLYNTNNNNNNEEEEEEEEEGPQNPWELPDGGIVDTLKFLLAWPINVTLWYTVPQCGKEEYKNLYMLSFFISTVWIAAYSYVMVWMVAYVGFALNISDTIMGLTFLAAGTSVPDTIASILVAQQGLGDMAVSNSIGSNVFDILLGLALPWSLSMIVANFMPEPPCFKLAQFTNIIVINSSGLVVSVALLLLSLVFVVGVIKMNGWKLNTKAGILIGIAYVLFLFGAIYNESNSASH